MLTAISTVYDREFGMLRLMLASPAGVPAVLAGRAIAATLVGVLQGGIVLAFAPLVLALTPARCLARSAALAAVAAMSAMLGLLVAARLRSVENFAGVINVVLFPLLFLSGALYPTAGCRRLLRAAGPGQSGHLCGGSGAPRARPAGGVRGRIAPASWSAATVARVRLAACCSIPSSASSGRGGQREARRSVHA